MSLLETDKMINRSRARYAAKKPCWVSSIHVAQKVVKAGAELGIKLKYEPSTTGSDGYIVKKAK